MLSPIELKAVFLQLVSDLSPENLSCDGELTNAQVNKRRKQIMTKWRHTERLYGSEVTEDMVWAWAPDVRKWQEAKHQTELAAMLKHPLLKPIRNGKWIRLTGNPGREWQTAYEVYEENGKYRVRTELDIPMHTRDKHNELYFNTLAELVDYTEAFLKTVTEAEIRRLNPKYIHVEHWLEHLPYAGTK